MIIYKIVNKINGKMYIGQTIRPFSVRKYGHYKAYLNGVHTKLYDAMRKYGWDNFEFVPICSCLNVDTLNKLETFFIRHFNTVENGYNMYEGGDSNPMFNVEIKNKHKKRLQSLEVRKKISEGMKESIRKRGGVSKETRKKLSEAAKKRIPRKGFKMPRHAVESAARAKFKPVYCLDEDGNIVKEFDSVKSASLWWRNNGYPNHRAKLQDIIRISAVNKKYKYGLLWAYK